MEQILIWITTAICVITVKAEPEMRTERFREVLHAVADKMGLDPSQSNFLTNQAIPIGKSIDQWIRRTYDSRDFPEWTRTVPVHVDSDHMVSYDPLVSGQINDIPIHIYRVLSVYLVDPATTDAPVETEFTLMPEGIHVGFDHGITVWIKYIEPAPRYTAEQWQPNQSYAKDDVAYSYTTGEVYKSKVNNNFGHDPAIGYVPAPPALLTEVTQEFSPIVPPVAGQDGEWYVTVSVPSWVLTNDTNYVIKFLDDIGGLHSVSYFRSAGATTITDILNGLDAAIAASGDPFVSGLTATVDVPNARLNIELSTAAFSISSARAERPLPLSGMNYSFKHVSSYIPPMAETPAVPQLTTITFDQANQALAMLYTLKIIDGDGLEHQVQYESAANESLATTILGITEAIAEAVDTDPWWGNVVVNANLPLVQIELATGVIASIDITAAFVTIFTSPYWELVPFPRTIANTVIRGAYADLLGEWGQSDKKAMEEQAVPTEAEVAAAKFQTTPNPMMTEQQRPLSRYRIQ